MCCVLELASGAGYDEQGEDEDMELKPSEPKKQRVEKQKRRKRTSEGVTRSQSRTEEVVADPQQSEDDGRCCVWVWLVRSYSDTCPFTGCCTCLG